MPQLHEFDWYCPCPSCADERERRGGMRREWPLYLHACLAFVALLAVILRVACGWFGWYGVVVLPVACALAASVSGTLARLLRYDRNLHLIVLWPGLFLALLWWLNACQRVSEYMLPDAAPIPFPGVYRLVLTAILLLSPLLVRRLVIVAGRWLLLYSRTF